MEEFDKIIIKDLEIFAFHGNNPEEKVRGQKFCIDLTAYIKTRKNLGFTDDLSTTVSYSKIIKKISEVTTSTKFNLIETLAEKILSAIFEEFEKILRCDIMIRKPDAPIKNAKFGCVGVEISRKREDFVR